MAIEDKRKGERLLLRFPEKTDLYKLLSDVCERNNRSLTAEIIFRLERSVDQDGLRESLSSEQATPIVKLEKRLDQFETGTDEKFEELFGRVNEIDRSRDALEQKVSDLEEALKRHGIEV